MNPILVERLRGTLVESCHRGSVSVVNAAGQALLTLGDVQQPIFPRSSIKFLQALNFVSSGALEHYSLDNQHIALSCASHNGEPVHVDLVNDWLSRLNLDVENLECGAELPMHRATAFDLKCEGRTPTRAHHNCSGKHMGMMSTCCEKELGVENYRLYEHQVQQRSFEVLDRFCSVKTSQLSWGYDGCGIPTLAMPLASMALGMARFADPSALSTQDQDSVAKVVAAVTEHPYLVAGKERLCTALMEQLAPKVVAKIGAEGVYAASIPERGLGIAIKLDDGHMSSVNVVLGAVLSALGEIDDADQEALKRYFSPSIKNSRGDVVGAVRASSEWASVNLK